MRNTLCELDELKIGKIILRLKNEFIINQVKKTESFVQSLKKLCLFKQDF